MPLWHLSFFTWGASLPCDWYGRVQVMLMTHVCIRVLGDLESQGVLGVFEDGSYCGRTVALFVSGRDKLLTSSCFASVALRATSAIPAVNLVRS